MRTLDVPNYSPEAQEEQGKEKSEEGQQSQHGCSYLPSAEQLLHLMDNFC